MNHPYTSKNKKVEFENKTSNTNNEKELQQHEVIEKN